MSDVTRILSEIEQGDRKASEQLLPLVYDELRKLAAMRMAQEKPGQTLQATALVHEAYVRLVDGALPGKGWKNRGHFFAAAAEAMRRILVEQARQRKSSKHGGSYERTELDLHDVAAPAPRSNVDLLDLHEALSELERDEPHIAELVKLRYFAGLSIEDAAEALEISPATAKRHWVYARAWLYGRMTGWVAPE